MVNRWTDPSDPIALKREINERLNATRIIAAAAARLPRVTYTKQFWDDWRTSDWPRVRAVVQYAIVKDAAGRRGQVTSADKTSMPRRPGICG